MRVTFVAGIGSHRRLVVVARQPAHVAPQAEQRGGVDGRLVRRDHGLRVDEEPERDRAGGHEQEQEAPRGREPVRGEVRGRAARARAPHPGQHERRAARPGPRRRRSRGSGRAAGRRSAARHRRTGRPRRRRSGACGGTSPPARARSAPTEARNERWWSWRVRNSRANATPATRAMSASAIGARKATCRSASSSAARSTEPPGPSTAIAAVRQPESEDEPDEHGHERPRAPRSPETVPGPGAAGVQERRLGLAALQREHADGGQDRERDQLPRRHEQVHRARAPSPRSRVAARTASGSCELKSISAVKQCTAARTRRFSGSSGVSSGALELVHALRGLRGPGGATATRHV